MPSTVCLCRGKLDYIIFSTNKDSADKIGTNVISWLLVLMVIPTVTLCLAYHASGVGCWKWLNWCWYHKDSIPVL